MQDKTKKKRAKKEIKVQDLKPKKDAKGGGGHTGRDLGKNLGGNV